MSISRRSFLRLSVSALAGAAVDPERLLWRPGKRTIFIPPLSSIGTAEGDYFVVRNGGQNMRGILAWISECDPAVVIGGISRGSTHTHFVEGRVDVDFGFSVDIIDADVR